MRTAYTEHAEYNRCLKLLYLSQKRHSFLMGIPHDSLLKAQRSPMNSSLNQASAGSWSGGTVTVANNHLSCLGNTADKCGPL